MVIHALVDVTKHEKHSDFGIFCKDVESSIYPWVRADIASAACPAHPGSLASINLVAVTCDSDDRCSVTTA